jgi:hypothetical protein
MTLPAISRSVKIIHPLDLLASKLHNLASPPEKRDVHGVAQARLAINVVRAFISQAHVDLKEREVFPFVEEVRRIALDKRLSHVCYEYNFDVLSAVPYEIFKDENFQSRRWPQIQALVAEQRRKQTR